MRFNNHDDMLGWTSSRNR